MGEQNVYEYEEIEHVEVKKEEINEEKSKQVTEEVINAEDAQGKVIEKELSSIEQTAYEQGWRPKDKWKGDPDEWVDAREFQFRGELMGRIQKQTKFINELQSSQDSLKEALQVMGQHNEKIAEQEYKRAIKSLKSQRREAMQDEDFSAADEIEEKIDELKEARQEIETNKSEVKKEPEKEQPLPAEVQVWLNKNKDWYDSDSVLRGAADAIARDYLDANPGEWSGALSLVDKQMRNRFPKEFGEEAQVRPAVSESRGRSTHSKKSNRGPKYSVKSLNDEQYRIAKTFVDEGVFGTMQDYVDQLAELGELDAQ